MGSYLNPGDGMFRQAIRSEIYVDKTELLKTTDKLFGTEQKYLCVSRPRRFGKTMAANMVVAYYDHTVDGTAIFSKFKIASTMGESPYRNNCDVLRRAIYSTMMRMRFRIRSHWRSTAHDVSIISCASCRRAKALLI